MACKLLLAICGLHARARPGITLIRECKPLRDIWVAWPGPPPASL